MRPRQAAAAAFAGRLLTSVLLAVAIVGLGFAGFLTGSLPRPLALALEPFSLLLLPGIVPALLLAGSHDFAPELVPAFAFVFYAACCFGWLGRGTKRRTNTEGHRGCPEAHSAVNRCAASVPSVFVFSASLGLPISRTRTIHDRLTPAMELFGCGTALVTPFHADGTLDERALEHHVHAQIAAGIELLVPCGSTGEASTLTEREWLRVIELTCHAAAGRVPVFAGCTHNATAAVIERAHLLSRVPGLTGLLIANPFYNRPSQEGQYQHFRTIAESTALPIMLYNIPGRTAANLEPTTVLRLAEIETIIGIKESSGSIVQITELLTQIQISGRRDFRVFSGDDTLSLPVMALGGAGLISVVSNFIPRQMSELVRATIRNDWSAARRLNRQFYALIEAIFAEPSPAPIKALLALCGGPADVLRLPMLPVTRATRTRLEQMAGELGLLVHQPPTGEDLRMF